MDLCEKYIQRTQMLLRLLDPEDMGHLVDFEARLEIQRCLKLVEQQAVVLHPDVCAVDV